MRFQKASDTSVKPSSFNQQRDKNSPFILPHGGKNSPHSFIAPSVQTKREKPNEQAESETDLNSEKTTGEGSIAVQTSIAAGDDENIQTKCNDCDHENVQSKIQRKVDPSISNEISTAHENVIQRSTSWEPAEPISNVNLARHMLGGRSALTAMTINGARLFTPEAVEAAMRVVQLDVRRDGEEWKASIAEVPHNTGGVSQRLLSTPPWTLRVSKEELSANGFNCSGEGYANFRVNGSPDDQTVADDTRRHEQVHENDNRLAFREIVESWDKRLTRAKLDGTTFTGATASEARSNLWSAMGGSPREIARAYADECLRRGGTFHETPEGRVIEIVDQGSDENCDNAWMTVR